jgi:uncharacterized protein YuzE
MFDRSHDRHNLRSRGRRGVSHRWAQQGRTDEKNGRFVYDLDAEGHIVGIEILSASKMLAPGDWQKARRPAVNPRERPQVAERHRGFIFIKRFSPSEV